MKKTRLHGSAIARHRETEGEISLSPDLPKSSFISSTVALSPICVPSWAVQWVGVMLEGIAGGGSPPLGSKFNRGVAFQLHIPTSITCSSSSCRFSLQDGSAKKVDMYRWATARDYGEDVGVILPPSGVFFCRWVLTFRRQDERLFKQNKMGVLRKLYANINSVIMKEDDD